MLKVRQYLDMLIPYIDGTDNHETQKYYEHLSTLRELVICKQHNMQRQIVKAGCIFQNMEPLLSQVYYDLDY